MKGNVLNEVSVREMSVFRHGLSLGSVTSTAPEELYLSSERIAFLLPRESCNYPTHLTNPLLGVHFTSFYILCLKFQICIELHFTKQYFLRHLISLFAYRTAQLVLKMKVEFMVQPISLVSDLKNNNTACLHLIFKDTSSVTLSRRTRFQQYVLTPGRPLWFVPRWLSCLSHRLPALTWRALGFFKIPL